MERGGVGASARPARAAGLACDGSVTPALAPEGPSARARHEARAGLYVHVPFCATRCTYCDFSSGALSSAALERYLSALALEAARRAPDAAGVVFSSVFFGGGTPSALSARHFAQVWTLLAQHFAIDPHAEITLEANPESVRPALLDAWARAGVNRLSMGAQSFEPRELAALGRIHSAARPREAISLARAHGFKRLSLDLMYGFPGHTLDSFRESLAHALACGIEHLSAYCFIPEPGTALGDAVLSGAVAIPRPEEQAEAYDVLTELLARAGFGAYETSNFCQREAEARHNLVYWLRRPYVGLGPSAHGLMGGRRYGNHYALARWAAALEQGQAPEAESERESDGSIADEVVLLGLRLATGLNPGDYPRAVREAVERRLGAALEEAVRARRLERTAAGVRIPPPLRFVADDAIAWIAARARRTDLTPALSAP